MAERQQDLGKKPPEQLQSGEFFSRLSLPDIYGRYPYPGGTRFPIDWDTYHTLTYEGEETRETTQSALMERFNIPSIAGWGNDLDGFSISPGATEPLGLWVPQQGERQLLTGLATGLAQGKYKPVILEVGAGTGIVSKVLAAESSAKVIALEEDQAKLSSLPVTSGDLTLQVGDIWSVLQALGPKYPDDISSEVAEHLENLQQDEHFNRSLGDEELREKQIQLSRRRYLSKVAVKRMQKLAPRYNDESPVDMVIRIAGENRSGLTDAGIRDGIHPKAIVYIRESFDINALPENWHEAYNKSNIPNNLITYFDPGQNYRTVAAWRTLGKGYWDSHMYNNIPYMRTEVVIQLRRDVQGGDFPIADSPKYPFDDEVMEVLGKYGKAEEFQAGLRTAKDYLVTA